MNKSDNVIVDLPSSGEVNSVPVHKFENVYYRRKSCIAAGNATSFEFERKFP